MIALPSMIEVAVFMLLLIAGLIIVGLLRIVIFLLPTIIVAGVVWFLTGSLVWAAIAFVALTILSIVKRH